MYCTLRFFAKIKETGAKYYMFFEGINPRSVIKYMRKAHVFWLVYS